MDNNVVKQIQDVVAQSKSIGIAVPKEPSFDEMAAGLGLYLLFKNAKKQVYVASSTDPIVEVSSLVGIDKVGKTLTEKSSNPTKGGDLTVSFPYTEGEIDKVSYTLEEGYLNIIVKASEKGLTFDEKSVEFSRSGKGTGNGPDVVFSIGVQNIDDLDILFDTQNMDIRIINIDNNKHNEQFGDINLVSDKLSSISEGIADLALALNMHIDRDSAQNLLSGISAATQNFQNPKSSSLAFEMASLLIKKGATREYSESARQGIKRSEAVLPTQSRAQTLEQSQRNKPLNERLTSNKSGFEEHLKKRVAEEKAREQAQVPRQPQSQSNIQNSSEQVIQEDQSLPSVDEAPNDWLAPKVYKGSSEV